MEIEKKGKKPNKQEEANSFPAHFHYSETTATYRAKAEKPISANLSLCPSTTWQPCLSTLF